MSEKQTKRHRRHQRHVSQSRSNQPADLAATSSSGGDTPPSSSDVSPSPSPAPDSFASSLLAISLQAAVPLRILACYERVGPTDDDPTQARQFGATLAERGDRLLFRVGQEGETADLFNQLA